NPVTVMFKITNGDGTALPTLSGISRVAFAMSGPSTDFGGSSTPYVAPTAVGGGSSGTLTGPDANGVYTYVTSAANGLPADASGDVARRPRGAPRGNGRYGQSARADDGRGGAPAVARRGPRARVAEVRRSRHLWR